MCNYTYIDPLSVAALIMYGKSIMTETLIGDGMFVQGTRSCNTILNIDRFSSP